MSNTTIASKSKGGIGLFFLITIIVHAADILIRLTGEVKIFDPLFIMLHFVLIPGMGWLLIKSVRNKEGIETLGIFALWAYIIPLVLVIPFIEELVKNTLGIFAYTAILLAMPAWFFFIMTRDENEKPEWLNKFSAGYMFIWFIVVATTIIWPAISNTGEGIAFGSEFHAGDAMVESAGEFVTIIGQVISAATAEVENVKQEIKGNTTQKDASRKINPSEFEAIIDWSDEGIVTLGGAPFKTTDELSVIGTLRTKTFSEDKEINVQISCFTPGATNDKITLTPETYEAIGRNIQKEKVTCTVSKNTLNPGTHKVTLKADYSMEAIAKLEFTTGKEELFSLNKYGEYTPKTAELSKAIIPSTVTSSKTPLKVDIALPEKYVVLNDKRENIKFTPDIIISRSTVKGEGKVKGIIIVAPKSFTLETIRPYSEKIVKSNCEYLREEYPYTEMPCDNTFETVYSINTGDLRITTNARISTTFTLHKDSWERFLGGSSFTQKAFYALAKYDYTINESKDVRVEGETITDGGRTVNSNIPVIISGPTIQSSTNNARIEIETNVDTRITIKYWKGNEESKSTTKISNYERNHRIDISNLEPGTKYSVFIDIVDRKNKRNVQSLEFTTNTAPGAQP
ncbi:hypothetical protein HY483_01365 [Candidatus Woesearchaeota archaeon]|nr:hypothetical protein [Candidatus Woesearchaeota archaeon]